MKSSLLKIIVAFMLPLLAINLHAQWSNDPTVNTPVSTAINQQSAPKIISDGAGGAIITWVDDRNGTTNNNIYVQRIDADGTVHTGWTADGIAVCPTPYQQFGPALLSDGAGGAFIVWADNRNGTNDIYAQRIDADGSIHTGWTIDGVVICDTANNQVIPQITSDGAGGAIITWRDDRTTSLDYDIYAQRIDADGTIHAGWTEDGVAICTAVGSDQNGPQLTSDGAGGAIITWYDNRNGTRDIYAQRIDADGTIHTGWTADGVAICIMPYEQSTPQIMGDGAGGAIITWEDRRSGAATRYDIYAQRIDSSGTIHTSWTADGVAICTAARNQNSAQIISDGYGGAIITWEDQRSGNSDVYAQRVDPIGVVIWDPDGVAICTEALYNQSLPQITSDGAGGAIITWYDLRNGSDYDIYAQKTDANGTAQWTTDGIPISTATNNQSLPQLTGDGAGGAIITWEDLRNGTDNDVYASHIFTYGTLVITSFNPTRNALNVAQNTDITVTFNVDMDSKTFTDNTVHINGSLSGLHTCVFSYNSGTYTATIDPNTDFQVGELVSIVLTHGIKSTEGIPLANAQSWSFTIKANTAGGKFTNSSTPGVGSNPYSITAGDLDGDGDIDLAATNGGSSTVSILLNDGSGTYTESSTPGVGDYPCSIISGDFDGDGDIDLVTTNINSSTISILLNDGSGTFTLSPAPGAGSYPNSVTASDLDGDGDIDLAVTNNGDNTVSILVNDGSGAFTQSSAPGVGSSPSSITSGDLDGDGDVDLATTNYSDNTVTILLNNGSGVFIQSSAPGVGNNPFLVTTADLDGDGDIDLAATNYSDNTVSILLNDGTGTFTQSSTPVAGSNPYTVTAGDLDGDGDIDLAVTNGGSSTVSILLNDGGGTFIQSSTPDVGSLPISVSSGDYDGDGDIDLAVANYNSNTISILKNIPDAPTGLVVTDSSDHSVTIRWQSNKEFSFLQYRIYGDTISSPTIKVDSTTGGISDTSKTITGLTNGTRYYFRITAVDNTGNESDFSNEVSATPIDIIAPAVPQNLVVTDSSSQTITINWQQNTEADFMLYRIYRDTIPNPTIKIDSTIGGITDTTKTFTELINGTRYYFRVTAVDSSSNESGYSNEVSSVPADRIAPAAPQNLVVTDSSSQTITINWQQNTEADFMLYRIYRDTIPSPTVKVDSTTGGIADTSKTFTGLMNGIRYYFRVTAVDSSGNESNYSNEVSAAPVPPPAIISFTPTRNALNIAKDTNITVTFNTYINQSTLNDSTIKINGSLSGLHISTFSYDSIARTVTVTPNTLFDVGDVVTATITRGVRSIAGDSLISSYSWQFTIKTGVSSGMFTWKSTAAVGSGPFYEAAADFNKDGAIDLATVNNYVNNVSILMNDGSGIFTPASPVSVGSYPGSITSADLNSDGYMDLATTNSQSQSVSILKNNQNGTFSVTPVGCGGSYPWEVIAVDVNGDGALDLASVNNNSSDVTILKNNGSGTFSVFDTIAVGDHPWSIAAADWDADGDMDLAVTNVNTNSVSILTNDGVGKFTETATVNVGSYPVSATAMDVNRDGAIDLAVSNYESSSISILINNGIGIFSQITTIPVGSHPCFKAAMDIEGDGDIDLAIPVGTDSIAIFQNNGAGIFTQKTVFRTGAGNNTRMVIAVDLNDDGVLDMACLNVNFNSVSIYLNTGPTDVKDAIIAIPTRFDLTQNYPNPFNPATVIKYQLPAFSSVRLSVYDILGREVATLVDGLKEAGYYTATFDGSRLASGIYFTRIIAQPKNSGNTFVQVRKMLLTK